MRRILLESLIVILYTTLISCTLLKKSIKGIFSAPILVKLGIVTAYTSIICVWIYKRIFFRIIAGIFIVTLILLAIHIRKGAIDSRRKAKKKKEASQGVKGTISYFDGLNKEEAKAEYHRLMNIYHPNKEKFGDLSKSRDVAIAYSKWVARYDR